MDRLSALCLLSTLCSLLLSTLSLLSTLYYLLSTLTLFYSLLSLSTLSLLSTLSAVSLLTGMLLQMATVAAVCVKWSAVTRVLSPRHLPVLPLVEIQSEQVLQLPSALCLVVALLSFSFSAVTVDLLSLLLHSCFTLTLILGIVPYSELWHCESL